MPSSQVDGWIGCLISITVFICNRIDRLCRSGGRLLSKLTFGKLEGPKPFDLQSETNDMRGGFGTLRSKASLRFGLAVSTPSACEQARSAAYLLAEVASALLRHAIRRDELRPPPRDVVTSQGGGLHFYLSEKEPILLGLCTGRKSFVMRSSIGIRSGIRFRCGFHRACGAAAARARPRCGFRPCSGNPMPCAADARG